MGEPRDEITGGRKGAAFRKPDDRWKAVAVSRRDQHDGIAAANGFGAEAKYCRRPRAGNSTDPEGKTADRSARRMEFAEAGIEFAACASEAREGGRLPGGSA